MLTRQSYLDAALRWSGKPLVKVITGLRRAGKSVILRQIQTALSEAGGSRPNLLFDMELLENDALRTATALHQRLEGLPAGVLLIDEVQYVHEWERLAASKLAEGWDVWLTGSNAHLLSSDLATHLTGRYVELPVWPLGLAEFKALRELHGAAGDALAPFMEWGGLPGLHAIGFETGMAGEYLRAVFDSILLKDVVSRFAVRNVALLERLARFVAATIGSPLSANSIAKFLKSQRLSVTVDTIQAYLHHLESAFLVAPVPRWDLRGKRLLEFGDKVYLGDTGFFHALLGRRGDVNAVLENLVFLELRRRGCTVYTGRYDDLEVDFIAERNGERTYLQVAYLLAEPTTLSREVRPLHLIDDNHPKFVLSLDPLPPPMRDGVSHFSVASFLAGESPRNGALG